MKKGLIAKVVGLGVSLLSVILFFVSEISLKMTATVMGQKVKETTDVDIWDIVTNKDNAFDDTLAQPIMTIVFALLVIATIYFAVSVVLEVLGKKLPVAQLDLVGAGVVVLAAIIMIVAHFIPETRKMFVGIEVEAKIHLETLKCFVTYVVLLGGAATVAANVVLKD